MSDPIQQIADQVARIAEQTALRVAGIATGTVLSVNPDGSVVVDDGQGGCARVANVTNQPTSCGSQVVLGTEPQIGNQITVCPVQVTITSSTVPCPIDDRGDDNETEVVVPPSEAVGRFATWLGDLYDGITLVESGVGDSTSTDLSYGYSLTTVGSLNTYYVGAAPTYNDLAIGHWDSVALTFAGNRPPVWSTPTVVDQNATVRGVGSSLGLLFGLEVTEDASDGAGQLKMVIRDAATYAVVATDPGTFLATWWTSNAPGNPYQDAHNLWHVSADPIDGSFWLNLDQSTNPSVIPALGFVPVWNISATDGSALSYIEIPMPGSAIARVERIVEIVKNGYFERGDNGDWATSDPGVMIWTGNSVPHDGPGAAQWNAIGEVTAGTHYLKQAIAIPATLTTATLEFWLSSDAGVGSAGDEVFVAQIRDATGVTVLATLVTYDNTAPFAAWTRQSFDIATYIGQTITLYFQFTETQADYTYGIYLDDVRIIS